MSVDLRRVGLCALLRNRNVRKVRMCQSISGALACAPLSAIVAAQSIPSVSVDLRRVGLCAAKSGYRRTSDSWCQSISGALACAPKSRRLLACFGACVSRSPARWPVRHQHQRGAGKMRASVSRSPARWPVRRLPSNLTSYTMPCVSRSPARWPVRPSNGSETPFLLRVSVDLRRVGLCAENGQLRAVKSRRVSVDLRRVGLCAASCFPMKCGTQWCQSISGALACAPKATRQEVENSIKCQSISGALACAPPAAVGPGGPERCVSVDLRRVGLCAPHAKSLGLKPSAVSVDLRRVGLCAAKRRPP